MNQVDIKKKITIFFAVVCVFNMAASFAHPVTPTLIVERELDSSMFGVALAAMQTCMFLFSPFWGQLCNYIPTRKVMLICCIGYAVGQGIFGMAQSEVMVMAGRMFAGVFTGGIFTAMSNYIVNIVKDPKQRGQYLTILITIQTVCGALGYFIGGMLGIISVEAAFIAQTLTLAVAGCLFYAVCLDDSNYKHKPEKPLSIKQANPFAAFAAAKSFMTPMIALICVMVAISMIGYNSFEQCFNYYIKDQFHLGSAYNGTIKAVMALVIFVVNATLCTYLQRKTDYNKTFLPVVIASAAIIGCIFFFDSLIPFTVIYIAFSALNAVRTPLLQTMMADRSTPATSNSVMGFYQAMNSLGGVFGALFAGLIYDAGAMLPFVLAFAAFVACSIVGFIYVGKYKKEKSAQ